MACLIRPLRWSVVSKVCVCALLIVGSTFAAADNQQLNSNSCNVTPAEASGLSGDLSTTVHAADDYVNTISGMLQRERFDQIDCLADRARADKERFPGGMWKLHELYMGLYAPVPAPQHPSEQDWQTLLARLNRWVAARPKSVTARVALAWVYIDYADYARGNGHADTVGQSGWKLMGERTEEAKRVLDEASILPTKCPEWYIVMQNVAQNESWDLPRMRALFEEAFKFEPGYYYASRAMAYDLLPKWFGEPGDTEKFVQEIADRVGGDRGDALYYEIASANYVICGCGNDDPKLSLERIERGFEASEKLYGVSMVNLNRTAYLAVHYGEFEGTSDPVFAEKLLTRIGDQRDDETWQGKERFETAKAWAAQWAPIVAAKRTSEAAAQTNSRTPEGARYQTAFEKTYRGMLQECVRTDGTGMAQWQGTFETMVSVGAKGNVQDGWIGTMGPVAMCVSRKLRASREQQSALFPPPPHDAYWVKVDLNWADFAPVAAK
jgi:hypothetical protein